MNNEEKPRPYEVREFSIRSLPANPGAYIGAPVPEPLSEEELAERRQDNERFASALKADLAKLDESIAQLKAKGL